MTYPMSEMLFRNREVLLFRQQMNTNQQSQFLINVRWSLNLLRRKLFALHVVDAGRRSALLNLYKLFGYYSTKLRQTDSLGRRFSDVKLVRAF